MKINKSLFVCLIFLLFSQKINPASLDGTTSIIYKDYHYPFANSDTAKGFVRLTSGFTIPSGAEVNIGIHPHVSGAIELKDLGKIKLSEDIYLDSTVTLSNGGYIDGQGNSIFLMGDITIPDGKKLVLNGNAIINGNNFDLNLGELSQLIIESNSTVTLKNIHIKNTYNNPYDAPVKCACNATQLTLDNTIISYNNDSTFKAGQLYINNDVIFTGTSSFIYQSTVPSYILPQSTLYFDENTIFDYAPSSTRNHLITLTDKSSSIYLNNCTLKITVTGILLTKGNLFLDNKVTLSCSSKEIITSLTSTYSTSFGSRARGLAWSRDQKYLAVTGDNGSTDLIIYSWNGSTLTPLDTKDFNNYGSEVSWSPDGNYLAVAGYNSLGSPNVIVYSWDGSTLTQVATANFEPILIGTWYARTCAWSPCGKYLAVGGQNYLSDLTIYSFDGSSLTDLDQASFGSGLVYSLCWSPDGKYLAAAGDDTTSDFRIYSWNGSSLSQVLTRDFGNLARAVAWSPDGDFIAVGGDDSPNYLRIYQWNGSIVSPILYVQFGNSVTCVSWSNDGSYLVVGGGDDPEEIKLYSWNGSTLTETLTLPFGTLPWFFDWSPDQNYLAVAGNFDFSDVVIYDVGYTITEYSPNFYNSIRFGDSSKDSNYNLNTYLLSGAQVETNCPIWIDDAN